MSASELTIHPELLAVLASFAVAALLGLPGRLHRRKIAAACASCGRRVLEGVKTCDCDHLPGRQ
jgi:hypothetical protein